jgi:KaiC/GvpD/RAD55 family RecA-like ATPase
MKLNYDLDQYWFRAAQSSAEWEEFQKMNFYHEPEISVVENVYSNEVFIADPKQVFDEIRNGEYKDLVAQIRQTDDPDKKRDLKKQLPAILFGATFSDSRKTVKEASNLICLDFDHVENIEKKILRLKFNSSLYGMFVSPSGDGLKVIIRTDVEDEESYRKTAKLLVEQFAKSGLIADQTKHNINDLCFFSYDPNAIYNPEARIWRHIDWNKREDALPEGESVKLSVENIIKQIEEKQTDITTNYESWLKICFALTDQFKEEGREYFHRLSVFHPEYDEAKCDKQYDYCLNSSKSGITIKTFFKIAKDNGLIINAVNPHKDIPLDIYDKPYYTGEELLLRGIVELPTLVDPILPKVGLVALGGSSDVGKSTFLRNLAIYICSGKDKFLQFSIKASYKKVIYVSTEDDRDALSYLLKVQIMALGLPFSSVRNLTFVVDTSSLILQLENLMKKNPVDLIIIDTFLDLFNGDMNQSNKIRAFMDQYYRLAIKYQCLILMLHHIGKRTEDLTPSKNNLLGSQGFEAKTRLVLELRKDKDDSELRHLCIVKANYLSTEKKEKSYLLKFTKEMLFEDTGQRVAFEDLVFSRKDREAKKEEWKMIAKGLLDEGKTYQEISDILKTKGFSVSKSTIQRELPKS